MLFQGFRKVSAEFIGIRELFALNVVSIRRGVAADSDNRNDGARNRGKVRNKSSRKAGIDQSGWENGRRIRQDGGDFVVSEITAKVHVHSTALPQVMRFVEPRSSA